MASPTPTTKTRGSTATKKMVGGMKALWHVAKKDLTENSRELKNDFVGMLEAAKGKMPVAAPKEPKMPFSLLVHQAVNVDVGSDLLSNFKDEWGLIHRRIEETSHVSADLNANLTDMHRTIQYTHTIISACCAEFKLLPEVVQAIETTRERVQELGQLLEKVEGSIVEYGRVRAKLDTVRKKESLKIQHEKQRGKLRRELQRQEESLAEECRLREEAERERESEKAAERQQTFQDMFQQQMDDYRETGSIDRAIGTSASRSDAVHLEDVTLEDVDGTASLNEFLSDVDDVIEESHDISHDSSDNEEPNNEVSHDPDLVATDEPLKNDQSQN